MILLNKNNSTLYNVYSKTNFNDTYIYFTDKGYISLDDDYVEVSSFCSENHSEYNGIKTLSENKYINSLFIYSDYIQDFKNIEQREEYLEFKNRISFLLEGLNEKIEIDYIQWKVKNGQIEEWQNNFTDKIIELSDTERFIDDDNYDIFYDINDLDNIEVVKKLS